VLFSAPKFVVTCYSSGKNLHTDEQHLSPSGGSRPRAGRTSRIFHCKPTAQPESLGAQEEATGCHLVEVEGAVPWAGLGLPTLSWPPTLGSLEKDVYQNPFSR
jgi:hypothetical protein